MSEHDHDHDDIDHHVHSIPEMWKNNPLWSEILIVQKALDAVFSSARPPSEQVNCECALAQLKAAAEALVAAKQALADCSHRPQSVAAASSPGPESISGASGGELTHSSSSSQLDEHRGSQHEAHLDHATEEFLNHAQKVYEGSETRHRIREEILATEKSYVNSLGLLKTYWVDKIKIAWQESSLGISEAQCGVLASNIETLYKFHQAFLKDLESQDPLFVARVILQYSDLFKLYKIYLGNYEKIGETLGTLKGNKHAREFVNTLEMKLRAASGGLDLMSFIIMPVQRIPRYVMLLTELRKNSQPTHPEYENVTKALEAVKKIAVLINDSPKDIEKRAKLVTINNLITDQPKNLNLVSPHRLLIREGPLTEVKLSGLLGTLQNKSRYVYLFNDVFIITDPSHKFKGALSMSAVKVETLGNKSIELSTAKAKITLKSDDEAVIQGWVRDLKAVQEDTKAIRGGKQTLRNKRTANKDSVAVHTGIVSGLANLKGTLGRKSLAATEHSAVQEESGLGDEHEDEHEKGAMGTHEGGGGGQEGGHGSHHDRHSSQPSQSQSDLAP